MAGTLRTQRIWVLGIVCIAGLLAAPAAQAADRIVLAENFAATWCIYCPAAGAALSDVMDNYPETFTFVQYHVSDDYTKSWGSQRANFYGVSGIPDTWFDGTDQVLGGQGYSVMRSRYLNNLDDPTDVTITMSAEQVSAVTYDFTVELGIEAGGTGKTLRFYMVQVLDDYPGPDQGEQSYYRNCFMQAMNPVTVSLAPGETTIIEHQFTMDTGNGGDLADSKVICWAQVPASGAPANVYNANQLAYPFTPPPPPGDWDGDGDVDLDDFTELPDCISGPDSYASRPCWTVFDTNEDYRIDLSDMGDFMNGFTGPQG